MSLTVLATNDDGIEAPGLAESVRHLLGIPGVSVYVAAPDREWSARGHAITITEPIYADQMPPTAFGVPAWRVSGSPADCVKLGLNHLVPTGVDLVVSGINNGPNLATDVLYSGTVAAAIEAVLAGIPALAVSITRRSTRRGDYNCAGRIIRLLVDLLGDAPHSPYLLNVNVPPVPPGEIRGVKMTELGPNPYDDLVKTTRDDNGRECYWLKVRPAEEVARAGTDLAAVAQSWVSITPLEFFDLTCETRLKSIAPVAHQLQRRLLNDVDLSAES